MTAVVADSIVDFNFEFRVLNSTFPVSAKRLNRGAASIENNSSLDLDIIPKDRPLKALKFSRLGDLNATEGLRNRQSR